MALREIELLEPQEMRILRDELERLAAGKIASPVRLEQYSGSWSDLAKYTEEIRKMAFGFASELQVTVAQVASAGEQIQAAVALVDSLTRAFDDLKKNTGSVETVMDGLSDTIERGEKVLDKVNKSFHSIIASSEDIDISMGETNTKLDNMQKVIGNIDGILARIDNISNRTRLLSLNASIEAAHAGIHGRSFAVVAGEMKNLAEQSSQGVKDTTLITQAIKHEVHEAITSVTRGQENVRGVFAGVAEEIEEGLELHHKAMNKIVEETKIVEQTVGGYSRQVTSQLELWGNALESLRNSSNLLEQVGEALASAVGKAFENGYDLGNMDDQISGSIMGELQNLASLPQIRSLDSTGHFIILKNFLKEHSILEAIYTNRADGTFIFSEPAAGLANAKVRPWWQEAMNGRIYKSSVYISAITRQPCLTVAIPIYGNGNLPSGVLGVDLTIKS